MKLLTTIAAVLISISAFSQDYVEYNEGVFSMNGEELSMQRIDDLTLLHKAGRGNFRRGMNFDSMHKNENQHLINNGLYFLGGAATGFAGGAGVLYGGLLIVIEETLGGPVLVAGAGLCVVSGKAFSRIVLSKEMYLPKRDYQFKKVAIKINKAIQSSNQ
ncbi:hypothetical protein N9J67_03600 [Schleiferiaceae bacterium]|nr:hypothetical protein [Schleiferiaceae bacterium]